ncbi:MAG: hypothetical protein PVSMB9_07980 [Candidatus Dormibacteria bacterium]
MQARVLRVALQRILKLAGGRRVLVVKHQVEGRVRIGAGWFGDLVARDQQGSKNKYRDAPPHEDQVYRQLPKN